MIRLKHLLPEQLLTEQRRSGYTFDDVWNAIGRSWNNSVKDMQTRSLGDAVMATVKNDVDRLMRQGNYGPGTRAEIIAVQIVGNGGYVYDDEPAMVKAFESIKNINEYNDVNAAISRETTNRPRNKYNKATDLFLGYFDNDQIDLHLRVLKHMMKLGGGYLGYRNSLIASDMYEYSAQIIVNQSYRSDILKIGDKQTGVDRSSYASILGWYKKYMYPETWQKWVDGEEKKYKSLRQDGLSLKSLKYRLNPTAAAEEAVYGSSSWISRENLQIAQGALVIGAIVSGNGYIATSLIAADRLSGIADTWHQYDLGRIDATTAALSISLQILPEPNIAGSQLSSNAKNYLKSSKNRIILSKKLKTPNSALTATEQEISRTLNKTARKGFELDKTIGKIRNNPKNRGVLPDESDLGMGKGQLKLKSLHKNKNTGAIIGAYGRDAAKGIDVFLGLPNPNSIEKYIAYKNVSNTFNPKFSIKVDLDSGTVKQLLTDISTILPYHRLTETTSISTDLPKFWGSQIKNGYSITNKNIQVKLNNAGKTELPGAHVKKGQDKFGIAFFKNIKDAESAKMTLINSFKQQNIPATVTIRKHEVKPPPPPPPRPTSAIRTAVSSVSSPIAIGSVAAATAIAASKITQYTIDIIMPELESTFKSLQNNGISRSDIDPAYLKKATRLK